MNVAQQPPARPESPPRPAPARPVERPPQANPHQARLLEGTQASPNSADVARGARQAGEAAAAVQTTARHARPATAAGPAAPPAAPGGTGSAGPWPATAPDHVNGRVRRHRTLPKLRIGRHHASEEALHKLQLAGSSFGVRLGRGHDGGPVVVPLFVPEPSSVAVVGGWWAARLVAFRALRFGARVVVHTDRPAGWADLGRVATGRRDRIAVLRGGEHGVASPSADAPVLSVHDSEAPVNGPSPAPWLTRLTLVRSLSPGGLAAVANADVVLLQRLVSSEAGLVAPALRVTPKTAHELTTLRDDMMAMLAGDSNRYLQVGLDRVELERLGRPGRY